MRLPGFTAELSLRATDELDYTFTLRGLTECASEYAITPQFIHRPPVDCDSMECYQQGGYIFCYCA